MKVACSVLLPLFRAALLREGGVRVCPPLHPGLPHLRLQGPGRLPSRGFPGLVYTLQPAIGIVPRRKDPFHVLHSFPEGRPPFYVLHSFLEVGYPFFVGHSVPDFMSYIVSQKGGSLFIPFIVSQKEGSLFMLFLVSKREGYIF